MDAKPSEIDGLETRAEATQAGPETASDASAPDTHQPEAPATPDTATLASDAGEEPHNADAASGPAGEAGSVVAETAKRLAVRVGRGVASAYRSVDPDLRRHIVMLPVMGLTQLFGGDREVAPRPDGPQRIVLFVHGLGGRPGNFSGMRTWLRLTGHKRHYAFALASEGVGNDLESMAHHLAARIEQVLAANPSADHQNVDIVAHSMGGIVSRLALTMPAVTERVASLVTLGTPHQGTWLARYADTALTRALRPGSELLAKLESQLPWSAQIGLPPLFAFWSKADMVLLPHDTAAVAGAVNVEVPGASHYGYLLRPAVWQQVMDALAGRPVG